MELLVGVMTFFVLGKISMCLPEWIMKSLENCWLSVLCFRKMCKVKLKKTLIFILGGLVSVVHHLVVDKSLINILYGFQKKKFPKKRKKEK